MPEVKWIKIVTEFFDDEKISLIESMPDADMILIIWIKLLTLAGKKNMNGYIFLTENIPYTDEMLSTIFKRPLNTIRLAFDIFKKFDMINYDGDGILQITNWEKHQNIEGMERIREMGALRQAKYMKRKKEKEEEQKLLETADVSKTLYDETREDKIREDKTREDKIREDKSKSTNFIKALEDFKIMRKKIRKPMTERAEELLLMRLNKLTNNESQQIEILNQSILNSWQGVFPLKDAFNQTKSIKDKVKNDNYDYNRAMGDV